MNTRYIEGQELICPECGGPVVYGGRCSTTPFCSSICQGAARSKRNPKNYYDKQTVIAKDDYTNPVYQQKKLEEINKKVMDRLSTKEEQPSNNNNEAERIRKAGEYAGIFK